MFHKESKTLDLLGQFSQKNSYSNSNQNDNNPLYADLRQLVSRNATHDNNRLFGIPNFIWYVMMLAMLVYLAKEMYVLNAPNTMSVINKALAEGTNKVTHEALEMQHTTQKAFHDVNTQPENK